jgi:hypothetical protein
MLLLFFFGEDLHDWKDVWNWLDRVLAVWSEGSKMYAVRDELRIYSLKLWTRIAGCLLCRLQQKSIDRGNGLFEVIFNSAVARASL